MKTENGNIQKGTHIEMFNSIVKTDGKYTAVLSANSVDRDGDEVSEKCLRKMARDDDYTVILIDHENKIENQIGEWTNKRIVKQDGMIALVSDPKFYMSNPKAQYIMNMLDEGAKMGISIGAKVVDYDKKGDDDGWPTYTYNELELLEASFVAIPSNRHGQAMAVAKSLKRKNKSEEENMSENETTYTQKDFDSKLADEKSEFEKKLTETNKALEDYKVEATKALEAEKKLVAEKEAELSKANEKLSELEALKNFKAKHEEAENKDESVQEKDADEELEKNFKAGKLPVNG